MTSACLDRRLYCGMPEITFASLRTKVLLVFKFYYPKSSDTFSNIPLTVPFQSCLYSLSLLDYNVCKEEALNLQLCCNPTFSLCSDSGCSGSPVGLRCLPVLRLQTPVGTKSPNSGFQGMISWNQNVSCGKQRIRRKRFLTHHRITLQAS